MLLCRFICFLTNRLKEFLLNNLMNNKRFLIALLTVTIYDVVMSITNPDGFSYFKIGLTLLVWISLYESVSTFFSNYEKLNNTLPLNAFRIFSLILFWNIINIIRSAFDENTSLTTLLGNPATSLALLVPFSLSFSIEKMNLGILCRFLFRLIIIGLPAYVLFMIFSNDPNDLIPNLGFQSMLYGIIFLIVLIPFKSKKYNLLILAGSILLFYIAIKTGSRTMLIRIILFYISMIAILLYRRFDFKWIVIVAVMSLGIPFYLLTDSIKTGQSAFEKYLPLSINPDFYNDTRTFLYEEVYDDLKMNNMLKTGKGSVARYYSPYFAQSEGDSSTRLSIEVGLLAILLSGGFIAVILNLALILTAIYLALFKSENYLVTGLGFLLIIHTLLLFIENFILYSTYNLIIWFIIGICLSKEIRSLKNEEIKTVLYDIY